MAIDPLMVRWTSVDASQAGCPGDRSPEYRERVAARLFECALKVAHEQKARYAPGHGPHFVLQLYWGENDPRNREEILPGPE